MNRIATGQQYASALLGVLTAQTRQAEAGRQVASGYLAPDLKGYASAGSTLQATQSVAARTDALLANNAVLADRLEAQDLALNGLEQAVAGGRKAVMDAVANGDGAQLVQKLGGWLGQATQSLNASFAGQRLFAGGTTDEPPVAASAMADLVPPGAAAAAFRDGALQRGDRIDEDTTVATSQRASDAGRPFYDVLAAIAAYDADPLTGPLGTKLTDAQAAFLTAQLAPLDAAAGTARQAVAKNGAVQAQLDAVTGQLTARKSAAEGLIDKVTAVDPAEAASRLQLAGVALQAGAAVFAQLSSSSLLDVLRR